jgi:proteic killer suppression protein
MIKSWKTKELEVLFLTGKADRHLPQAQVKRILGRLTVLNQTTDIRTLQDFKGYELHKWPNIPDLWSISVSGPWRILFRWIKGDAYDVELHNPH